MLRHEAYRVAQQGPIEIRYVVQRANTAELSLRTEHTSLLSLDLPSRLCAQLRVFGANGEWEHRGDAFYGQFSKSSRWG